MKTEKYTRKRFDIEAVQVTAENILEVAEWCQGTINNVNAHGGKPPTMFIHVKVHHPLTERQTKAYIGDWVLFAGKGFKCYTNRAFQDQFDKVLELDEETKFEKRVAEEVLGQSWEEVFGAASPDKVVSDG